MTTQGSCFSSPVLGPKLLFTLEIRRLWRSGEKVMACHSSTLAWKIPWTQEPGGLQSLGSLGVGHDWVTSLSLFTFTHWRRKWQPTPVFLPGESQGQGSPVGCHLWGRIESNMTEVTSAAAAARSGSLRMQPSIWGPNLHKHLSEIATRDKSESTLILKPIW